MLPKSWLAPKAADAAAAAHEPAKSTTLPAAAHDDALKPEGRPGPERAVTAALSTPHDAVLAELQGRTPRAAHSRASPATASPEGSQPSPPGSAASPEAVYEPSTGTLAYVLPPRTPPAPDASPRGFAQSKDELWSQLGRIRDLQSAIAVMHVGMEGIGGAGGDGRGLKKAAAAAAAAHARTPTENVLADEWPDPALEEEEKRRERDADFANLAQAFQGRHAAIENIMDKLDELSKSLAAFHALPTPTMEFVTSRNNTKDSVANLFNSPSPTFTAGPSSPQSFGSTHVNPSQLHTALHKLHIPRTESPDPSPVS